MMLIKVMLTASRKQAASTRLSKLCGTPALTCSSHPDQELHLQSMAGQRRPVPSPSMPCAARSYRSSLTEWTHMIVLLGTGHGASDSSGWRATTLVQRSDMCPFIRPPAADCVGAQSSVSFWLIGRAWNLENGFSHEDAAWPYASDTYQHCVA